MMKLPEDAYKHLEIAYVMDKIAVHTPYGDFLKKQMKPYDLSEIELLKEELEETQLVVKLTQANRYGFIDLRNQFKRVKDLRGTFSRIRQKEILSVTELFEIKSLAMVMKKLALSCEKLSSSLKEEGGQYAKLPISATVVPQSDVEALLDPTGAGVETFYIYDDYSENLRELRAQMKRLEDQMAIERKHQRLFLEDQLDVRIRPNGEITVGKDDLQLMERIKNSESFIYSAETYMNTTFKIRQTEQSLEWLCELEGLRREEEEAEFAIRKALSRDLLKWVDALEENANRIGRLDLLMAKASFAVGFNCTKPELLKQGGIFIENGRHIKVEAQLKAEGRTFEGISVHLSPGATCITGANMGGKTVSLKLIGMLTAMAQYGLFVPAEAMKLCPRAFIYTSIGDLQNIDQGLSTFGAEIIKVRDAIKIANMDGLILIDELARGTNPREGYAISKAIIGRLKTQSSIAVITTHFDGLADDPEVKHLQVLGLSDANFDQIMLEMENDPQRGLALLHESMDYRLKEIHTPEEVPKDAIHIAQLMGLDEGLLEAAKAALLK